MYIIPKRRKKKKKNNKIKFIFIALSIFCFLVWLLYLFIIQFESYVVPTAIKISEKYAVNIVSQEINKSVENVINDMDLYSGNFLKKTTKENTSTNYLDIDTMLINTVCNKVSNNLSENLKNINNTKIELPIGILSGINAFSNIGPNFTVLISSLGDARVDYETNFESVGINQINFQIYLNIDISIGVVNPMFKKDINLSRKLMLVNTIFNGEVPNTYFNMDNN